MWNSLGATNPGVVDATEAGTECPTAPIGKYTLENVVPGEYVLEIARQGFMPRYGIINVSNNDYIGHREILGGEVNNDLVINELDLSAAFSELGTVYGLPFYNWKYDFNGDRRIDNADVQIIRVNLGATKMIDLETKNWLDN
jgi:hypothetical protein